MRCLRKGAKKPGRYRIRNERIREELKLKKNLLPELIEERPLKWFAYGFHMAEDRKVKPVKEMRVEGRMRRK